MVAPCATTAISRRHRRAARLHRAGRRRHADRCQRAARLRPTGIFSLHANSLAESPTRKKSLCMQHRAGQSSERRASRGQGRRGRSSSKAFSTRDPCRSGVRRDVGCVIFSLVYHCAVETILSCMIFSLVYRRAARARQPRCPSKAPSCICAGQPLGIFSADARTIPAALPIGSRWVLRWPERAFSLAKRSTSEKITQDAMPKPTFRSTSEKITRRPRQRRTAPFQHRGFTRREPWGVSNAFREQTTRFRAAGHMRLRFRASREWSS